MSILALMALVFVLGMASKDGAFGCLIMLAIVVGMALMAGGM